MGNVGTGEGWRPWLFPGTLQVLRVAFFDSKARTVAALVLFAGATYAACAQVSPSGETPDASTVDSASNVSPATCPEERPAEGAACTHPEGTTCAFGSCAAYAVCSIGTWRIAPNPKPPKLCPALVPEESAPCDACFEDGGTCTYGDPTCTDASTNAAIARCRAGRFSVRFVSCVEAGTDAGPPKDAETDAPNDGG